MCFYACAGVLCMACEREMFLSFIYKRNIDRDGVQSKIGPLDH